MAKIGQENQIPTDLRSLDQVEGLMPIGLEPLTIKKMEKPVTSEAILAAVQRLGMTAAEIPLHIFRQTKFGKPRRKDNHDLVVGYPFYGIADAGVANLKKVMEAIKSFVARFRIALKDVPLLEELEEGDLKKISILRPVLYGRHLMPPIALDLKYTIPSDFKSLLQRVVKYYVHCNTYHKNGRASIYEGTDAKDTSLGSPTFYVGDQYHAARLATMSAIPVPDYSADPAYYVSALENWGTFMPDSSLVYASYLSYRQGATNKPSPSWYTTGLGFEATHETTGMYSRQRAVWAAPFFLNVLLTPLVLRMKSSRQNILGMWHDPSRSAIYIPRLQKQGKKAIEIDYSAYDTTINNELMTLVYTLLESAGYAPWESGLMKHLTPVQGALCPSFFGDTSASTYFRGNVGLMSGLLPTSELGSIISISLVLYGLSKQHPNLVEAWFSGKFIILVQSDDVLFTTDLDINQEQFAESLLALGITAKVQTGCTFLKRFLPVGGVQKMSKPFSRNIQQTIGNEDTYDGKPPAILRLALSARCESLNGHPLYSKYWPELFSIYEEHFDYVREIEDKKSWLKGDNYLNRMDLRSIEQYAITAGGSNVITNLLERAAYDPSAASVIEYLKSKGLTLDFLQADQVSARKAYTDALFTPPTSDALASMLEFARWR